ncbi:hypothetical protein QVD17_22836 [Tagetes erecta]|uniref:Uncharacterized protein n=1 Tax=Tagetes erecta TaxID=13708 RepID=A0AAD8NTU7_TARER|nr:hypothetical protein QVD17_22836 [Tagetes erecta]
MQYNITYHTIHECHSINQHTYTLFFIFLSPKHTHTYTIYMCVYNYNYNFNYIYPLTHMLYLSVFVRD